MTVGEEAVVSFHLPRYTPPDFTSGVLAGAPAARTEPAPQDGVAPHNYHATSNHPEYVRTASGKWVLARESRMDCVLVLREEEAETVEARRLQEGDPVVLGRTENGEEGVLVYTKGFEEEGSESDHKFSFRTRGTRTSFTKC